MKLENIICIAGEEIEEGYTYTLYTIQILLVLTGSQASRVRSQEIVRVLTTSPGESLYLKRFCPVSSKGLSMYVLTSIYCIITSSTGPSVFA